MTSKKTTASKATVKSKPEVSGELTAAIAFNSKEFPLFVQFLSLVFAQRANKTFRLEPGNTYLNCDYLNITKRESDYLVVFGDTDVRDFDHDLYVKQEIEDTLNTIESSLERAISQIGDNSNSSMEFLYADIDGFPGCCGANVITEIPQNTDDVDVFVALLQLFMMEMKGKASRMVTWTDLVKTDLYKRIQKGIPGIKIAHTWKNPGTKNDLYMAVLSPEECGLTTMKKSSTAPKKKATQQIVRF